MTRKISVELDIQDLAAAIDSGASQGLKEGADLIAADARLRAPHRTGHLANSTQAEHPTGSLMSGDLQAIVASGAPYATFVEFGTGIYGPKKQRIYPKTKKAMKWRGADGWIVRRSTKGMRAKPFLIPAMEANAEIVAQVIADAVEFEIESKFRS